MDNPDHETKSKIRSDWFRVALPFENDSARQYLDRAIAARNWCTDQFGDDNVYPDGFVFYFKDEEDSVLFKMTWAL